MQVKVKVITRAAENRVIGMEGDTLKVRITSVPEKGKANQVLMKLLAEYYGVSKSSIKIIKGKTSSQKVIEVSC